MGIPPRALAIAWRSLVDFMGTAPVFLRRFSASLGLLTKAKDVPTTRTEELHNDLDIALRLPKRAREVGFQNRNGDHRILTTRGVDVRLPHGRQPPKNTSARCCLAAT